jgi:hypothetical protein
MKKLYLTKVNPFAQAKWQNKKKKKTNASPISGRCAQYTDETLGWRAETEISVRLAHGDTRSATFIQDATGGKNTWISHTRTIWRGVWHTETRVFAPIGTYPKFGDIFQRRKERRSKNGRKRPKIAIGATARPNQSHSVATIFPEGRLNNYQRVVKIWDRNLMDFFSIV